MACMAGMKVVMVFSRFVSVCAAWRNLIIPLVLRHGGRGHGGGLPGRGRIAYRGRGGAVLVRIGWGSLQYAFACCCRLRMRLRLLVLVYWLLDDSGPNNATVT